MTGRGSFRFGTLSFSLIRRDELQPFVHEWVQSGARSMSVLLSGAHGLSESRRFPRIQQAHDEADLVLCDGVPAFVAGVLQGHRRSVSRITGLAAMVEIGSAAAALDLLQVFAGGPPGLAEGAHAGLEAAIGRRIRAFTWSPPFAHDIDDAYADEVADRLRTVDTPAVVWIGLGTPKQELLAAHLRRRLPSGFLFATVGAAFDMYAGNLPIPPAIMSNTGTAWLYRLWQEPRRLAGRYARAFPVVVAGLAGAAWRRAVGRG